MIQFIRQHYGKIGMSFALVMLIINHFQRQELAELRKINVTLQNQVDSLHDEAFNAKVEAGRYELTLDHLNEVNPKLGKEMEVFMENETE